VNVHHENVGSTGADERARVLVGDHMEDFSGTDEAYLKINGTKDWGTQRVPGRSAGPWIQAAV
jgi:hypothetical protein